MSIVSRTITVKATMARVKDAIEAVIASNDMRAFNSDTIPSGNSYSFYSKKRYFFLNKIFRIDIYIESQRTGEIIMNIQGSADSLAARGAKTYSAGLQNKISKFLKLFYFVLEGGELKPLIPKKKGRGCMVFFIIIGSLILLSFFAALFWAIFG